MAEVVQRSAASLFAQKGFFETTMKEIAQHAGVAVGSIYNYYSSKEALLDALYANELVERQGLIGRLNSSDLSAQAQLEVFINDHVQRMQANPDLAKVLVSERRAAELNCPSSRQFRQTLVSFFAGLVEESQAGDRERMAVLAMGALEAATTLAQTHSSRQGGSSFADAARCFSALCSQGIRFR